MQSDIHEVPVNPSRHVLSDLTVIISLILMHFSLPGPFVESVIPAGTLKFQFTKHGVDFKDG